jgi:undecaprenyl-diphosphatase
MPLSSSGHLIIVPALFHWTELTSHPHLNKTFDVALHVGTLVAALWYFRHDLARYVRAAFTTLRSPRAARTTDERVAWLLLASAVPGAVIGALFSSTIEDELGDPVLIGAMFIVFAVILGLADRLPTSRDMERFKLRDAVTMGLAQAVALQPGVSRSGVTISAGRWLRFDRPSATRLSFLMSIPIIAGAALYKGGEVFTGTGIPHDFVGPFIWGMVASAVSGFAAIAWLLRLLKTHTFTPFIVYRILAGAVIIVIFATGIR